MSLSIYGLGLNSSAIMSSYATNPADKKPKTKAEARAEGAYYADKNESVADVAKKFNMTADEFKKRTGFQGNTVKKGSVIYKVPSAKPKTSQGVFGMAKEYGMTEQQFRSLNGMGKTETLKADQTYLVFPKKEIQTTPQSNVKPKAPKLSSDDKSNKIQNRKAGKYYVTPGNTVYSIAGSFNMTVDEFKKKTGLKDNLLSVGQVIDKVPSAKPKKGESVGQMAKRFGMSESEFRELNMLDKSAGLQVNEQYYVFASPKSEQSNNSSQQAKPQSQIPQLNPAGYEYGLGWVKKPGGFKDGELRYYYHGFNRKHYYIDNARMKDKGMKDAAQGEDYRGKTVTGIERPNGNIIAGKHNPYCELLAPKSTTGKLAGKVIILNPGHGGYQNNNDQFDPGVAIPVPTKKVKGVQIYDALEEWEVARSYADALSDKLRANGATVIMLSGPVRNGGMASLDYLEGLYAGTKGPKVVRETIKKTKHSDMLFMSMHLDGAKGAASSLTCGVNSYGKYDNKGNLVASSSKGAAFASNIASEIGSFNYNGKTLNLKPEKKKVNHYVTRETPHDIPSVLLEIGNLYNKDIQKFSLNKDNITAYTNCLYRAIVKTMTP